MASSALLISFLAFLCCGSIALGKEYVIDSSKTSLMVKGTSTLHDWELSAKRVSGAAQLNTSEKSHRQGPFSFLRLSVPVSKLSSDRNKLTENAQKALKMRNNPEINFELKKAKMFKLKAGGNEARLKGVGRLQIAGKTKETNFTGLLVKKDQGFALRGTIDLNMTDFGIDPPSYLLMRVGPKVIVDYELIFKLSKE